MSKPATGSWGYTIRSRQYIQNMNNQILIVQLLNNKSDYNYRQALDKLYAKINDRIDFIHPK